MNNPYLFVYGTLMQQSGHPMHERLKAHSEFVCHAWMSGQLYQIHDYPGVIESGSTQDKVYGEVYRLLQSSVLAELDDFEQCTAAFAEPHEYIRKQVTVFVTDSRPLTAWAYIYNHSIERAKRIHNGRFQYRR